MPKIKKITGRIKRKRNADGTVTIVVPEDQFKVLPKIAKLPTVRVLNQTTASVSGRTYQDPFEAQFYKTQEESLIKLDTIPGNILLAQKYMSNPPIGRLLSSFVEFSISDLSVISKDPTTRQGFEDWNNDVHINEVQESIYHELFSAGNVFILPTMIPYKPKNSKKIHTGIKIPGAYTILNAQYISSKEIKNETKFVYEINSKIRKKLLSNVSTPQSIRKQLKEGSREIVLENVSTIFYHKADYDTFANPLLASVFKPLFHKNKLRELDLNLIEAGKHRIYLVTIGDSDHIPLDDDITNLVNQFNTPSPDLTIFGDWTIKIEIIQSNLDLLKETKYNEIDKDILGGLNAPSRVIRQPDERGKNENEGMMGFTKFIHYAQGKFKAWLDNEYRKIATVMEFETVPTVFIPETVIIDPYSRVDVLNKLKDRAVISCETAYNEVKRTLHLKNDYETEKNRIIKEQQLVKQGLIPMPMSPYQTSPKESPKEPGRPKKENTN